MSKHSIVRWIKMIGVYLLVAAVAALGWLWCVLPEEVYLEPEQPHCAAPLWLGGTAARTRQPQRGQHPGSGQLSDHAGAGRLAAGQDHPCHRDAAPHGHGVRHALWGEDVFRGSACGGLFRGAHRRRYSEPRKAGGLRLGDRVIRMGNTVTETNEQVHAALEAAAGAAVEVVYVRKGEQRQTILLPVWDTQNAQWRAGMWVRDSSAGVGTLTFVDAQAGVFAGLGHPISDSDTGERVALRSGEIVACQIVGCTGGTAGSPGELKGKIPQRPRPWKDLHQRRKWCLRHGKHRHCRAADRACLCAGGAARRGRDPDHHQRRKAPQLPCLY